MVGYTALHAYHDHCYFTHPWLGQYVDYSDAMRRAFVRFLRKKYTGDLKAAGRAHGKDYHSWADIAIPAPEVRTDAHGRIQPRGPLRRRQAGEFTEYLLHALEAVGGHVVILPDQADPASPSRPAMLRINPLPRAAPPPPAYA